MKIDWQFVPYSTGTTIGSKNNNWSKSGLQRSMKISETFDIQHMNLMEKNYQNFYKLIFS